VSVESIAADLYGLDPGEFTAARNTAAKSLSGADAVRVKGLKKPAPAAWVMNLLVRERAAEIERAVDLGRELRGAQDDLDREAITSLGGQRRKIVAAIAGLGGELAEAAGHPVSAAILEEVGQTIQAAMSSPSAAAAVQSGRLIRSLMATGVDDVDVSDAVAIPGSAPAKGSARKAEPVAKSAAEKKRAQRELDAAREASQRADTVDREAADAVDEIERRRAELAQQASDLREQIEELEATVRDRRRQLDSLDDVTEERKRLSDVARSAHTEALRARRALDRLER
jgi:DNA repair exonuclease SbcCD ATPase subunit